MNNRVLVGILVAVLLGFGVILWRQQRTIDLLTERAGATAPDAPRIQPTGQAPKALPALSTVDFTLSLDDTPITGASNARVVMLEFSDFQCPFCGRHVRETAPKIDEAYVKTGKIRHGFRQFPLESIHPNARGAAVAALCAGDQGKFWEAHARLFSNSGALDGAALLQLPGPLGLNAPQFSNCLSAGRYDSRITADRQQAIELGFTGTPGFVIGTVGPDGRLKATRRISGAQPYSVFEAAINAVLEGQD